MSALRRRLASLEGRWTAAQPRQWQTWRQDGDDPCGWFVDGALGERRHWLELEHDATFCTISRVVTDLDGTVSHEMHIRPDTGSGVMRRIIRTYRGVGDAP
jgi:hypothetical protein